MVRVRVTLTRGSQCFEGRPTVILTSPAAASLSANCGSDRVRVIGIRARARARARTRAGARASVKLGCLRVRAPGLALHVAAPRTVAPPPAAHHPLARLQEGVRGIRLGLGLALG